MIAARREVIDRGKEEATPAAPQGRQVPQAPLDRRTLSARERRVVDLRARGLLAKEIAHELDLTEVHVRVILHRIRQRFSL